MVMRVVEGTSPSPIPLLLVGALAIALGTLVLLNHARLFESITRGQGRMFGRRAGRALSSLQSSFWVGFAGAWGILLGVIMCFGGLVIRLQRPVSTSSLSQTTGPKW